MELTYKELQKRDVINISDGRCLGRIIDATFSFPKGVLGGITVPGKNTNCIARIFDKSSLYIEVSNIVKIGGDVILVNLNCGEVCSENVNTSKDKNRPSNCNNSPCLPNNPCNSNSCHDQCNNSFKPGIDKIDLSDY